MIKAAIEKKVTRAMTDKILLKNYSSQAIAMIKNPLSGHGNIKIKNYGYQNISFIAFIS